MISDKKGLIVAEILLLKVEIKSVEKLREKCKRRLNLEIFNENIIFRLVIICIYINYIEMGNGERQRSYQERADYRANIVKFRKRRCRKELKATE